MRIFKLKGLYPVALSKLENSPYYYQRDRLEDFFEVENLVKTNTAYPGNELQIIDPEEREVFRPFEKRENVLIGEPMYYQEALTYLLCDFNKGTTEIYRGKFHEIPRLLKSIPLEEVNTYNLRLLGEVPSLISEEDEFTMYWPRETSFSLESNETVVLRQDRRFYTLLWYEGEQRPYYEMLRIRDLEGKILKEREGSFTLLEDGRGLIG